MELPLECQNDFFLATATYLDRFRSQSPLEMAGISLSQNTFAPKGVQHMAYFSSFGRSAHFTSLMP